MQSNSLSSDLDHILAHTENLWDEFRGRRILITGGTGFFGCWLLESWTAANDRLGLGAEAIVLTRDLEAFRTRVPHLACHPSVCLHQGDVRDFEFPEGPFSHVIHAATPSHAGTRDDRPLAVFETIVEGTRRTLEFARQKGAGKFLLTSSGAVYGRQPGDFIHICEEYPGGPDPVDVRSEYGEGKRVAELLCALFHQHYGLETKIARCFALVGPYLPLDAHFAIGNFIGDGLSGGPVRVGGDGTPYRSYLYAADLVIWLWTILIRGELCRPYNVGSEVDITIGDLARRIAEHFGVGCEIARESVPGKTAERYVPSTRRADDELGLKPWISLDEAIERTAQWHRSR